MKFLVGILLVVIGLASTAPLDSPANGLAIEDFDDFLLELGLFSEENVRVDEDVETQLKDRFEYILEKIKEAIDDGKAVKEDLLTKLKEIKAKLKSKVGDKAKALVHKIKESGRNYLRNFLKGLGLSKRDIEERSQAILDTEEKSLEEVQKELKERFDEVLNKIKDAIDQGKNVKEDMLKKMKDLRQKMKDMNLELGNKSKAILDKIKDKGRDFLKDILKKLGFKADALLAENQRSADIDIFGMIDQLKDLAAEELINALKEKGEKRKQKILEWIERIFKENQE
ncbi:hypothetical protein JTE90_026403 [Oedothorax gibbosus]|uniref:Uncharacterized protein n=1 Tax=Oedothorax gibbosus TaxID=931172 RepID=A0AAV6VGN7_9ARAC|nr:hypothetical protein JTE90_026403 [Oedothorax gibbosus]